ncbi:MAG TPA: hypothetical protein PLR63_05550 [Paludibacteraceae bacterium]|nr:hypothetical protein [Paludibacteraceae bacterium]
MDEFRNEKLQILFDRKKQISRENFNVLHARYCEKKIINLAPENLDNLFSKTIAHIAILRGIKSLPDEVTYEGLKRALTIFSDFTMAEINLAFELDNLRVMGDRTNHFGLFSVEFFTDVLIKFREYRSEIFIENKRFLEAEEKKDSANISDRYYYDSLVDYVKEKKIVPEFWAFQNVFQHMKNSAMITESQKWKDDFISRVKRSFENEKQIKELNGFKFGSETLKERVRSEYVRHKMNIFLNQKTHLSCE